MQFLLCVVVLLLVAAHVQHLLRPPRDTTVIQTRPDTFSADLLLEKQPIVVDGIPDDDPTKTVYSLLRYMYVCASSGSGSGSSSSGAGESKHIADAAYTALWPAAGGGSTTVHVVHPRFAKVNRRVVELTGAFVEVRLRPGQVLILPFQSTYRAMRPVSALRFWDVGHALALAARRTLDV